MHPLRYLVVVLCCSAAVLGAAVPSPAADEAEQVQPTLWDRAARVLQCADWMCVEKSMLLALDNLSQKGVVQLVDGVAIVGETSRAQNGRALTEGDLDRSLSTDAEEKESQVETMLVGRIARYLQEHTLQFKVPDSAIAEVRKTLDEARGKKKKLKMLLPILLLAKLKAAALIPLALGALALLAFKALIVGKLALLLAGLVAVQKLLASRQHTQTYEVVAHPHYSHSHVSSYGDEHGHYARALPEDGADIAYSSYAPQ